VNIANVNSDANGTWTVTYLTDTTFRLDGSVYGAGYSSGGTASEADSDWADIGYSYSRPAILNSQAGWIVIFGNGYNSASGEAKLIILDAASGTLVRSIDTQADACNGLSSPTPIDVDFDGKVDYVFAGDLKGNMWKFDLTDADENNWDVAYKSGGIPKPLFHTVSPEGQDQPITTKADVMDWCTTHGYMVVFGTGKWMGEFDFESTITQSIYGIWDYGDDSDDSEYLGNFDRGNIPELTNMADTVTLLGQTVLLSTETDPNFWTVNDQKIRILTNNVETVEYPWETSSYLVDGVTCGEGTGTEDCDPNGVPSVDANPDPVNLAGWYFDLPFTGERIVSDALIRQGNAIFVAYTPEQTPCGSGGSSVIMEMDACTGGRTSTPQFDINEDQVIDENDMINIGTAEEPIWVTATGIQSPGRLQPPAILRMPGGDTEMKYFSSSRGQIVTVEEKAVIVGISYWLEFE